MKGIAVTVIVVIIFSSQTEARPKGKQKEVCTSEDLIPQNLTNQAVGPIPYLVDISEITEAGFIHEKKYSIQLTGTEVEPDFRGFIIQAISCNDDKPVGVFIEPTDASEDPQYKLQCGDSVATHNNKEDKASVQVWWTAPPCGTTNCIIFRYSFVDIHRSRKKIIRYWANEETPPINEARCTVESQECFEACVTACPPTCEDPEPASCEEECVAGCQCPYGTVLDEKNNKCVLRKDCGCPVKGQVRMDCAPSPNCARTCDNYDQLLGCPPECGSFNCICPNGMVIDKEKNTCVEQTGCPVKCEVKGQEFKKCGNSCPPTCEAPNPIPCTKDCVSGCQCRKGLVFDEENNRSCPVKGQIRMRHAPLSMCAETCNNLGNPPPSCPSEVWDEFGCACPNGTVLDEENNECLDQSECPTFTITFNRRTYSVDEDDGSVQLVLVLSNLLSTDITVLVAVIGESATGGDFDDSYGLYNVTFPAGETTTQFDVPIPDDNIFKGNENLTIMIDPISLHDGVTLGDPGSATVTIVDNDMITVNFDQTVYNVDEDDGSAQPVLVLSNPSSTDITVVVFSTDGSATGGVDYSSGLYSVKFLAGETIASFDIPIADDGVVEGDEDLTINIDLSSLPDGVSSSESGSSTVNIRDDDIACEIQRIRGNVNYDRGNETATLTFSVRSTTAMTECKLDNGEFSNCVSPVVYSGLRKRKHFITVRATCPDNWDSGLKKFKVKTRLNRN